MFIQQIRNCPRPFTFTAAINIAASFIDKDSIRTAHRRVQRGVAVLESDKGLNDYLVAYGEMHVAKVKHFLPPIPFGKIDELNIVDWGCGQGLATAVVLEYLRENSPDVFIRGIRLIEISAKARDRALEIVSRYENAHDARTYKWDLQSLLENGLQLPLGVSTLHLFSNILDVVGGNNKLLHSLLYRNFAGVDNYLLCVGPKNHNAGLIRDFYTLFDNSSLLFVSGSCVPVSGKYYPFHRCSCYGLTFLCSATSSDTWQRTELPEIHYDSEDLLIYASANMESEIVEALQNGVDVNYNDEAGNTAALLAAKYGCTEALRVLIDAGADLDKANVQGATPLYFAAKYGEVECIKTLLEAGAEKERRIHNSGLTPYLVAAKYGRHNCISLLADAGCDTTVCDIRGRNAKILTRLFAGEESDDER